MARDYARQCETCLRWFWGRWYSKTCCNGCRQAMYRKKLRGTATAGSVTDSVAESIDRRIRGAGESVTGS